MRQRMRRAGERKESGQESDRVMIDRRAAIRNTAQRAAAFAAALVLCIACLLLPGRAAAVLAEAEEPITPNPMKEWNDGANVAMRAEGKAEAYRLTVFADTTGLEEGYYSVYLYDTAARSVAAFDGIRFFIENSDDEALKINLTLVVSEKISVTLPDTSYAMLEADGAQTGETAAPQYGALSIPAHFSGMVYIPFAQLYPAQGEQVALKRIQSWGLSVSLTEGQEVHFTLGDIAFLKNSVASMRADHFFTVLSGKETVTIPAIGAITENYQARVLDLEGNPAAGSAVFYLEEDIAGVTLAQDGSLEVGSECVATRLTIRAKLPQAVTDGALTVSLKKSAAGADGGVPTKSQIGSILLPVYAGLMRYESAIRLSCGAIALVLCGVFIHWAGLARQNLSKPRQRAGTENQDAEGHEA